VVHRYLPNDHEPVEGEADIAREAEPAARVT